jgi:beta-N-acetylhexosaminidase
VSGGGLLVVGVEGLRLAPSERRTLKRVRPFGVVLVQRNVGDLQQLRILVAEIRAAHPRAVLCLDAEGGRVDRLRGLLGPAPAADLLALRPPALARRAGRWVGAALRGLDFDLDFAPVVDLDRGRAGNALDRRCLGSTPRRVVARARAFTRGLEGSGVGACLKHFPGLGGAGADTHLAPARIELSEDELEVDLAPFRSLARETGAVMAGHAVYPALDPSGAPATLSPAIATERLRGDLGFRGALFSDDLEMGALDELGDLAERGERALRAGCDALLFCRRIEAAPEIGARLGARRLSERRREAEARLEAFRRRLSRLRRGARRVPIEEVRRRLAGVTRTAG